MVRKRLTPTFRVLHKWFIALVSLGKQTPPNPRNYHYNLNMTQ